MPEYICYHDTPLGRMTLRSDGRALTALEFDEGRMPAGSGEEGILPVFAQAKRWLDLYFSGEVPGFTPETALRGTAFRRTVWDLLREIPCGETVTYGEIALRAARRLGLPRMSAQAVGGAVGHNPVALIIPCHRVVGADGSLTGYAAGLWRKEKLLEMEQRTAAALRKESGC